MSKTKIAIAQIEVEKGNVEENIRRHIKYIENANKKNADYIVFPELSLTGYEPDLVEELVFAFNDERLEKLKSICNKYNITAIVGAPLKTEKGISISEFIIHPNYTHTIYSKRYLHIGEDKFFVPGELNPILIDKDEIISFAICADIVKPIHALDASKRSTSIYIASVLISETGYNDDVRYLEDYSKEYNMLCIISNFAKKSGGYTSAGKSGVWYAGKLVKSLKDNNEGMLLVTKENDSVNVEIIES